MYLFLEDVFFHLSIRLIGSRFPKELFARAMFIHQYDSGFASGKELKVFYMYTLYQNT